MKKDSLSLRGNKNIRFLTVTMLYFAQGIMVGLMAIALPAYFAQQNLSAGVIGSYIAVITLPWSLKIIFAPLMDRFTYLPMGRKRPWVILGAVGSSLGYFILGMTGNPDINFDTFLVIATIISTLTAMMDVATDGMTIDITPDDEQATINGLMWGGRVFGTSLTTAAGTYSLNNFGFDLTFYLAGIIVFSLSIGVLLFAENIGEKFMPWTKGYATEITLKKQSDSWYKLLKKLLSTLVLYTTIILLSVCLLSGIASGILSGILPVIATQEYNWTSQLYSNSIASSGLVAGGFGMITGGLIVKNKVIKSVLIFIFILVIVSLALGSLNTFWKVDMILYGFIAVNYILTTLFSICLFAICMSRCWELIGATQFATYMAVKNLGTSVGAGFLGIIRDLIPLQYFFIIYGLIYLIIFILFFLLKENELS